MKSLVVLGCLFSFIGAGVIHFLAEGKSGLKSKLLPESYNNLIDQEIAQLNIYRLIAFSLGIIMLILSIKLLSNKNANSDRNPEVLDE
jgi:hypothetical protein